MRFDTKTLTLAPPTPLPELPTVFGRVRRLAVLMLQRWHAMRRVRASRLALGDMNAAARRDIGLHAIERDRSGLWDIDRYL